MPPGASAMAQGAPAGLAATTVVVASVRARGRGRHMSYVERTRPMAKEEFWIRAHQLRKKRRATQTEPRLRILITVHNENGKADAARPRSKSIVQLVVEAHDALGGRGGGGSHDIAHNHQLGVA